CRATAFLVSIPVEAEASRVDCPFRVDCSKQQDFALPCILRHAGSTSHANCRYPVDRPSDSGSATAPPWPCQRRPAMSTFFRHLRIGHRLVLCFSLILLLMMAGSWLAISS